MSESTARSHLLRFLKSCSSSSSSITTSELKQAHAHLTTTGLPPLPTILHLSARSTPPDPLYTRLLFSHIPCPTYSAWNSLFRLHAKTQDPASTISLYKHLLLRGAARLNGVTFAFVLKACASLKDLGLSMSIHTHFLSLGFHSDVLVLNSSIHAYAVCGSVASARHLFDVMPHRDLISWTEVIHGYVRSGLPDEAVRFFLLMMGEKVRPDEVTVVGAFNACSQIGDLSLARKVERMACEAGVRYNVYVLNSLIDMYGKCGSVADARKVFDGMQSKDVIAWNSMVAGYARSGDMEQCRRLFDLIPEKNEVSWSSLINGYVQNGCSREAVREFQELQQTDCAPNEAAITGAITACAHLGAIDLGREIHQSLDESKVRADVVLSTALVDMYAKCGCLGIASKVFDRIVKKNIISWNVMMMALAIHGKAYECLKLLAKMLKDGLMLDSRSFTAILTACDHAGWLRKGINYFDKMVTIYGISPSAQHCCCMVHLIGRAGLLAEAHEFIRGSSPAEADVATWGALLSACQIHSNLELGEIAAEKILQLEPYHTGACVQLSSMYSAAGKWKEAMELRKLMKDREVSNRPGLSWFELYGMVHEFLSGANSHPRIEEIDSVLHSINRHMSSMHLLLI